MAAFTKVNGFAEHLGLGLHHFGTDQLKIGLVSADPTTALNASTAAAIIATVTLVSTTNLSGANPLNVTTTGYAQASGTFKLVCTDLTLTATGDVGPFQYVVLYNDATTSPADAVIGHYNYGSAITLHNGETLLIDFDGTNGVLTVA